MPTELFHRFIETLQGVHYTLTCRDHAWNILFPSSIDAWKHQQFVLYEQTFYIHDVTSQDDYYGRSLEVTSENKINILNFSGSQNSYSLVDDPQLSAKRKELIVSGVFRGKTTGAPVTIVFEHCHQNPGGH